MARPSPDRCSAQSSRKGPVGMKTENRQRQLYDREYATLPQAFRGFENWRLGYIQRMFAELAVVPEDILLDVGVGGTGFSKVISNAVLEHVEDDDVAFDELGRASESSGRVLVCVPNSYMFMAWPLALLNLVNDRRVGHLRHYASTDLIAREARRRLQTIYVTFHAHVI